MLPLQHLSVKRSFTRSSPIGAQALRHAVTMLSSASKGAGIERLGKCSLTLINVTMKNRQWLPGA